MTYERGCRRIGWVLIALSIPFIVGAVYEASRHVARYEPFRLDSPFAPDFKPAGRTVSVDGLGLIHFPASFSDSDIDSYVKAHFTAQTNPDAFKLRAGEMSIAEFARRVRTKRPEFTNANDVELTKEVLAKFPEYRETVSYSEYTLLPRSERRPWWSAGVSIVALAILTCIVQGSISIAAWVIRGFVSAPVE
jgi:hypothetical protein